MTSKATFSRRTNRRRFLGGLAGSAAAIGLAGTAAAAPGGAYRRAALSRQGGEANLSVWGGVPEENGPADLVAAFQKANPNIKVKYTRYVNDDTGNTQLDTALQGGTPIDVYFSYDIPRMSQRIKAGVAADLTANVNADATLKQWAADTSGIFAYQDKYYSLPTTRESSFFFVNKQMTDAAGSSLAAKWTFDDFRALSKQLSSDNVFGTYAPPELARMLLGPNYWYKVGGKESNFDDPAFKQQLELHRGMIEDKTAFPWTDVLAQNLRAYPQNVFLTEQVATWSIAAWALRYVRDKEQYPHDWITTFLPLPQPGDVTKWYDTGGLNNWIMMHPDTKAKDAAWTFIDYWLTDGAQYMLKGGKVPAVPGTDPDTIVAGILGPDPEKLFDVEGFKTIVTQDVLPFPTDTITTASAEIQQIYQQQTDRYLIGEIEYDEWVQTTKQQADKAIASALS